ncbi:MAG TPA: POTRA domain-containing protein [Vicinamibacterales bacterium]|jgi:outer membrane protein assembly complex protein YaeT
MRTLLTVIVALASLATPCTAAAREAGGQTGNDQAIVAIDAFLGRPIVDIRLQVQGQETADIELKRVLETQVGSALAATGVRESIIHLMALRRFQEVQVRVQENPHGVALLYELVPVRSVRSIEFRGDLGLSARQLRAAVVPRYTSSPPVSRAEEIARMLEALCHDHGFLRAVVHPTPEPGASPDRTILVFNMVAGPQARVGALDVVGAPDSEKRSALERLGLRASGTFDRVSLEEAVARYVITLRARGYLEAAVQTDFVFSTNRERVDVTVRMARGPLVRIEFRGDPLPENRKNEIASLTREGTLDEDALENAQVAIENDFRANGYRDASAAYTRERRGDDQLLIVFSIRRGPQYKVESVRVTGNDHLSRDELSAALRAVAGQWFVQARVDADVTALTERYRRAGYGKAVVKATSVPEPGRPTQLAVEIAVQEGPRTTIGEVAFQFQGGTAIAESELRVALRSQSGAPYYQPQVDADREAVLVLYLGRGYQLAAVDVSARLTGDGTRADLRFLVREGPQLLADHILVVGNVHTKVATIERELGIRTGTPLSAQALADAQRRLIELGLFRRVQVSELQQGTDTRRDVLVVVEEAPVNTIGYGAGFEGGLRVRTDASTGLPVEKIDVAPRGFFEVGRRNLWGKNRAINLFARGAIRTSDQFNSAPSGTTVPASNNLEDTSAGFREFRLLATYREPRFLNSSVDVVVTAGVDQAIRSTFDFNRRQLFAEGSHRFSRTLSVAGRYSLGRTRLFNERIAPESELDIDKIYSRVRLSSFSASVVRNTRDDAFEPTGGNLVTMDGTLAARAIGSQVGFAKGLLQAFSYRQVPILRGSVVAVGARLGLAFGFPQLVADANGSGKTLSLEQEIPASERFFAGGDTSVRGFALDKLGAAKTLDQNGVSNGGNGLLIFNGELRIPLFKVAGYPVGAVTFIDTGNVFAKVGDIGLNSLRSGAGVGLRLNSPIGPLRVDLAWKLNPMTFANGIREDRFAWYVTIGQAF